MCLVIKYKFLIPWKKARIENDAGNLGKDSSDENSLMNLVVKFILRNRFKYP